MSILRKASSVLVLAAIAILVAHVANPTVRNLSQLELSSIVGGQDDTVTVIIPNQRCEGNPSQSCSTIRPSTACTSAQNAAQCTAGLCMYCNSNTAYKQCIDGTITCTNNSAPPPGPCGALMTASCFWGPPPGNPTGPLGCRCPAAIVFTNTGIACDQNGC